MGPKYIDNFGVEQLRLERSQWALHVDELSGLLDHPNPINSGFKIYLFFFYYHFISILKVFLTFYNVFNSTAGLIRIGVKSLETNYIQGAPMI